jgi:type II secretory pathway pseudopilin PulG
MQWLDRSKELVAIAIATVAVILSLVTVIIQKRQQQREAFRQIQDALMSAELQRGRWLIIEISVGKRSLPEQFSPEFYLLNRTLGMYDTLAMYVRRRVVPRRWVLDMWHHPLAGMRTAARQLARRHQEDDLGWTPWPELWSLMDQAARYHSSLICCASPPDFIGEAKEPPPAA